MIWILCAGNSPPCKNRPSPGRLFENAGGSYTCAPVIDRLTRFYRERKVQPYAPYEASRLGGAEMDEARARMAAILGVETEELSFGPSTTQNIYVLAQAFRQWMKPGDAIIVTNQDHEANTGPWRRLAEEGIEVREWQIDSETGHLDPEALGALLDERVRLVCFPHCSNVIGEINPVMEITALAHAAGAFTCVDGVSYAPHGFPDVGALGADIYLFSSYKTYGPHQGLMVIRNSLGRMLPNQGHYFNADTLYKRFTPAGPDHAQVAACAGMADYVDMWRSSRVTAETRRDARRRCMILCGGMKSGSCSRCLSIWRRKIRCACLDRGMPGRGHRPWRWPVRSPQRHWRPSWPSMGLWRRAAIFMHCARLRHRRSIAPRAYCGLVSCITHPSEIAQLMAR